MTTVAIVGTTAEGTSGDITLTSSQMIHVYASSPLNPGERVYLEITPDSGSSWFPVENEVYRGTVLRDTIGSQTVGGPGTYRLKKTATEQVVEVYYD